MPESIHLNRELNLIEVRSFGDISTADLYTTLTAVLELIKKYASKYVLVDTTRQTSLPKLMEYKRFIDQLPESLTLAILVSETSRTRNLQHMGEFFAQTMQKNYKLFYERDVAENWLRNEASSR